MLPLELITTTGLADEIAYRLQAGILEGAYPPGTHLFQDELCERFGVSRTPVREALRKLQAQHLVMLVPNKGATVRVPTRQELIDVYAVRAELEGFACALASSHVTSEVLAALEREQARINQALRELEVGDLRGEEGEAAFNAQLTRANLAFHGVIAAAAANERLRAIIEDLARFFPKDYVWRAIRSADEAHALHVEEHDRIREALAARDARRARREMRTHILHASRLLVAYLDQHSFWK